MSVDLKRNALTAVHLLSLLVACFAINFAATAQDIDGTSPSISPEIAKWNDFSSDARELADQIRSEDTSDQLVQLETVRSQLAAQRDRALAMSREQPFEAIIAQGKLDLLSSVPEGGESDFAASKRVELEEEVYRLTAPQRAYSDSYLRSVATISIVDGRIDDLVESKLLTRGQSPLLPGSWIAFSTEVPSRFNAAFSGNASPQPAVDNAVKPQLLLLIALGILLGIAVASIGRSKLVSKFAGIHSASIVSAPARAALIAILRDIAGLALAIIGVGIIALTTLVLVGSHPQFGTLPIFVLAAGLPLVIASWVGTTLFAPDYKPLRFVALRDKGARRAALLMLALGASLGLETIIEAIEDAAPFSRSASGIGPFIVMLAVSLSLYGLARTIEIYRIPPKSEQLDASLDDDERFLNEKIDWTLLLTGAMKVSAIASAVLAVIGFGPLARFAILPTIESLLVIALLSVVYSRLVEFIQHLPALDVAESSNTLLAAKVILFAAFVAIAAPIIAVFWGVRPAELADLVILLRDGITIGGTTISLGTVFVFFAVFAIGYIITRWVQRALQTMLLTRLDMDDGTKSAIVTGTGYIGVVIAFVAAIGAAGIDLSNLAIIFGALSVGIGFGMQSIVSNFVSGIIMLVERPIKEGDSIEVGGHAGIVDKISVRATRIQSFDHDDVIIPNSELITGTVRNRTLTDRLTRIECSVGIAYDSDLHEAFDILYDIAKNQEHAMSDPTPNVVMEQLGDSALMLRLYCFVDEVGLGLKVRSQMYVEIVRRFAEAGITIPFPQRDVNLKTPKGTD